MIAVLYIVEIKKRCVFKIIWGIKTDVDLLQKLILTQIVLRKYGTETEEMKIDCLLKNKVSQHVMFRNNSSTGRRETLSIYA